MGMEALDGRRARSERSRERIIEAVLTLVKGGMINPGAQRVADLAQVSLRTVYRHFEDIESLYEEIANVCESKFMPIFMRPYVSTDWKGQLGEHLNRRLQVFEDTLYLRLCTNSRRFQSPSLMQHYNRYLKSERSVIEALIPEELQGDTDLVAVLDIAMCFGTYHRLRLEIGYSPAKTKEIVTRILSDTIRDIAV